MKVQYKPEGCNPPLCVTVPVGVEHLRRERFMARRYNRQIEKIVMTLDEELELKSGLTQDLWMEMIGSELPPTIFGIPIEVVAT